MGRVSIQLLAFCAVHLFLNTLAAQEILKPILPNISKFPIIKGEIVYRGFGQNLLSKDQLKITENGQDVNFQLENYKTIDSNLKNKRVLFLIENHWLKIGYEEREYFSRVLSKGILGAIQPGDQIMVCSFDWYRNGKYLYQETSKYTDNIDEIIQTVNYIKPHQYRDQIQEGSDINEALMEALHFLGSGNDTMPSSIFLFSDELDNTVGKTTATNVKEESINRNIPIYAISYFNSSRYGKVIQEQICLPSFGLYYVSKQNNIDSSAEKLNFMLNTMIQNSRGSTYIYSFNTAEQNAGKTVNLDFSLQFKNITKSLTIVYPALPVRDWISQNPILFSIIILVLVVCIAFITLIIRRKNDTEKQKQSILEQTQMDLIRETNKRNLERTQNEETIKKMQLEQKAKFIATEKLRTIEKNNSDQLRLQRLMHKKGTFPKLTYLLEGEKESISIIKPSFSIGREKSNDLSFNLTTISKEHLMILFMEDGTFILCDINSTNGTYLNGHEVKEELLKNGDIIQIDNIELVFTI